jgi:DNA recombination-dependent growth factor C
MGLLKGNITFSRFRVCGEPPQDFSAFVNRQIRKFAFQELALESEELSMGWTSIDNVLDTNFEFANYALGDYLIFSLRVDKKSVPPSLLRIKASEAEKALMAEKQQERLYRDQRKQILDAVRNNLLAKALPAPSFYDICWCVSKKWLVFGSHTESVSDSFCKLFERTFDLKLQSLTPWDPDYLAPAVAEKLAAMENQ